MTTAINIKNDRLQSIPTSIPTPQYAIGQYVQFVVNVGRKTEAKSGLIVGQEFISLNAALHLHVSPGWVYLIELPPFSDHEIHYSVIEEDIGYVVGDLRLNFADRSGIAA